MFPADERTPFRQFDSEMPLPGVQWLYRRETGEVILIMVSEIWRLIRARDLTSRNSLAHHCSLPTEKFCCRRNDIMKENRNTALWAVICLVVFTLSCTPQQQTASDTRPADEAAIRAADNAWS